MAKNNGYALKGSKRMMQILVNEHCHILNEILNANLKWLSPLESDNYKEFQLNGEHISKELGLDWSELKAFWPTRQPQWDGLAISHDDKGSTLYLFETKSHLDEISSGNYLAKEASQQQKDNYKLKENTILDIAQRTYQCNGFDKIWLNKYYQISNRLVFLEKMKEFASKAKFDFVKLVFLNFENDPTWGLQGKSVCVGGWQSKYEKIFKDMGDIADKIKARGAIIIDIDVKDF